MPLTLKSKIALGVVFLFTLLLLMGGTGLFFLHKTTSEQQDILKNNYETIEYTRNMLQALDSSDGMSFFEKNLVLQEKNITEPGEGPLTVSLRKRFGVYQTHRDSAALLTAMRQDIHRIMELNLSAIIKKNQAAKKSAENARSVISMLLTICILLGFTFVFNFPGFIANPISKLTEGIKAIAAKNYGQRIRLERSDEFGDMAVAFNHMAEELDKYEHSNIARILFEKQRAETVISSLKDASIGIDADGRVLFANAPALRLLGVNETDIVGKKVADIRMRNDLFDFLLTEKSNQPFKVVQENREQFYSKEMAGINNNEGTLGTMIVLKNITPFKELDVAKTHFIATISHELKTPLASSDFSLKLLENERTGTLNEEQKQLVQNLKEDNQRLLKILSELLDISQVESGKIQLNIAEIDAKKTILKAMESVSVMAAQKNIQIRFSEGDDALMVKGDAEKITWVLINFLTNAVKFSAEGKDIHIQLHKTEGEVLFEVADEGRGISPEHAGRVFERFYQVPGTEKTGNGLGLSICKEFIEAMNGRIGVHSEAGKGSRFYFFLPSANA
jgi:signal transduction histidine kinase/HAMP domain-containing protein